MKSVMTWVGAAPLLLVLDGLDKLVQTTDETVTSLLTPLLTRLNPEQRILITCRETSVSAPGEYAVPLLDRSASLQLFYEIALPFGEAVNFVDEEQLETLLDSLGDLPLAIILMAHSLLNGSISLAELVTHWHKCLADVQHLPEWDRQAYLSAMLAIHRLQCRTSRDLFEYLAYFPAGMYEETLISLFKSGNEKAADLLLRHGLAVRKYLNGTPDGASRECKAPLALLNPVAGYALHAGAPRGIVIIAHLVEYYQNYVEKEMAKICTGSSAEARERLLRELPNIHAVINGAERLKQYTGAIALLRALKPLYWWIKLDQGLARMRQGESLAENTGDEEARAFFICAQGDGYRRWASSPDDYESARSCYQDAKLLYRKSGNLSGMADCLKGLGDVHRRTGLSAKALERYGQARGYYDSTNNHIGFANVLRGLAHTYRQMNCYGEALHQFQLALAAYQKAEDEIGAANCLRGIGEVYCSLARYDEALMSYHKAQGKYEELGHSLGQAHVQRGLADILWLRDRYSEALQAYSVACAMFEQLGDKQGMARCLYGQGGVYRRILHDEKTFACLDQALDLYIQIDYPLGQARCLRAKADMYRDLFSSKQIPFDASREATNTDRSIQQGYAVSAFAFYDEAQALFQSVKAPQGEADCMRGMAELYAAQGQLREAQRYFEMAQRTYVDRQARLEEHHCLRGLATVYIRQVGQDNQRLEPARDLLEKAFALYVEVEDRHAQQSALLLLEQVYQRMGDCSKAQQVAGLLEKNNREIQREIHSMNIVV